MLRYMTAGESHGKCLVAIIDGIPAGLKLDTGRIDCELRRRMLGHGRGKRMGFEKDRAEVLSGVRKGVTIGSPISIKIDNVDHSIDKLPQVYGPRPGHADLAGMLKYDLRDARSVLERASARETAARVALGAVAKALLEEFGIRIASHVTIIGGVEAKTGGLGFKQMVTVSERSPVRCADPEASKAMCRAIDDAAASGDTLGGMFEVIIAGVPAGLGSYAQWDRRLDARLAYAVMSIQAVKAVGFGAGFAASGLKGSEVHDQIFYKSGSGFYRNTNNAGGIEGGVSNGEDIIVKAVMKPISTLRKPLSSVDIRTKKKALASVERSDACAVPAAGVIGEAVSAVEIANAFSEKFGGDSVGEMKRNFSGYLSQIRKF